MEQRRLLSFLLSAMAFFFFYMLLLNKFGAKPVPNQPQNVAAEPGDDGDDPAEANVAKDADTDVDPPAGDDTPDLVQGDAKPRPVRPTWISLGSMDPATGYQMMATLNSKGGGVERIELTTRDEDGEFKYRRIDIKTGYLGYFAGEPDSRVTGVRVNVVGDGTPASLAKADGVDGGIQVDDVIVGINAKEIRVPGDIVNALKESRPGDAITVKVTRGAKSKAADENGPAPKTIDFNATLSEHPLDLVRLARYGGEDQVTGNLDRLSCLMTLETVNEKSISVNESAIDGLVDPMKLNWNSATADADDKETAVFDVELSAGEMKAIGGEPVRLTRTFSLAPNSYLLDMSIEVENLGQSPQKLAYRLEGVNGVTMEGWWYSTKVTPSWSRAAARDIIYKTTADGHEVITGCNLLSEARDTPKDPNHGIFAEDGDVDARDLKYIGVDAQYFNCAYLPAATDTSLDDYRRAKATLVVDEADIKRHQEHAVNSSFKLDSLVGAIPPKGRLRSELRLFAGPKEPEILNANGLGESLYYGWFWWVAKPLISILHILYAIVGNYAIAVILLTVCVRGMMFPLSRKAAVNAQRMQELAPEMKKIAEKYKDDMEGRLKAQRELQARVGFNPMAGCLPMFLQFPIFIALYRSLAVDIELRQSAVSTATSWASNLAGPDMVGRWDSWLMEYFSGRGTGWLGPYFNILPLIVVALFLTQQKLFMPPATDEQTAMTQKLMGFMTLFMGLFFFRVPAALCLYFIASSIWGICERVLVKKTLPTDKHFDQDVIDGKATAKEKVSLADRIREQMGQKEEPKVAPNKRKRPPNSNKKKR